MQVRRRHSLALRHDTADTERTEELRVREGTVPVRLQDRSVAEVADVLPDVNLIVRGGGVPPALQLRERSRIGRMTQRLDRVTCCRSVALSGKLQQDSRMWPSC